MKETSGETGFSIRSIFVGRFGLRAGWSIILSVALLIGFNYGVSTAVMLADGTLKHADADRAADAAAAKPGKAPEDIHPKSLIRGEAIGFTSLLMAAFCLSLIERRKMSVYGIGVQRVADFLPGAVVGVAAISLMIFLLVKTHSFVFDERVLSGPTLYLYALKWLLGFLLLAFAEEYLLRGFLMFTLTRGPVRSREQAVPGACSRYRLCDCSFIDGDFGSGSSPGQSRRDAYYRVSSPLIGADKAVCAVAHGVALVGYRISYGVGLVAELSFRGAGLRENVLRSTLSDACDGQSRAVRRVHWA